MDRQSTLGFSVFVGDNLVSWKNKKQNVARSTAESEYMIMAFVTCELLWMHQRLDKIGLVTS